MVEKTMKSYFGPQNPANMPPTGIIFTMFFFFLKIGRADEACENDLNFKFTPFIVIVVVCGHSSIIGLLIIG